MSDLLFFLTTASTPDLVFGEEAQLVTPADTVFSFSASLPGMTVAASLVYESEAQRPVVGDIAFTSASGVLLAPGVVSQSQVAAPLDVSIVAQQRPADDVTGRVGAGHHEATPVSSGQRSGQMAGLRADALARSPAQLAVSLHNSVSAATSVALWRRSLVMAFSSDTIRDRRSQVGQRGSSAKQLGAWHLTTAGAGGSLFFVWQQRHSIGVQPQPGIITIGPPPPVDTPCYRASPDLIFRFRGDGLWFVCDNVSDPIAPVPGVVIPRRAIYMQHNTVSLVVTATGQSLALVGGLNISIDRSSWIWGWQAQVPAAYFSIVSPVSGTPVDLTASINGIIFRLLVINIVRDREFGGAVLTISGQGRAAVLGDPFARTVSRSNNADMTARQLMDDALTDNGVPIGWGVDWRISDWIVPGGVWQHYGTSIDALLTIARAAGAYVQAHPHSEVLSVLPEYPLLPWEWQSAAPDIELPDDVCITESIEWISKPDYNAVYISGQDNGVQGRVVRNGTAGDVLAPMITDPLITHADAVRQRGRTVLSDTGEQKLITLSMPLAEAGIIAPGKLVRYTEGGKQHVGLSRGVNVSCTYPKVRQSVTIESHVF